jgi:arylsulfatase A-like enzyme
MTGLPPQMLGVDKYRPLPRDPVRLAEIAWAQGYRTAAIATNAFLTEWFGFDRGFEFFEHSLVLETLLPAGRSVLARELTRYADENFEVDSAEIVIPKAVGWLRRRSDDAPFFLWVHLMNPHLPYRWRKLPATEETPPRGRVPDAGRIPNTPEFAGRAFAKLSDIREGRFLPDAAAREGLRTLYDREVQFADYWTGKLLEYLRGRGVWQNTMVVVLADHGEELFDHGGFEHGHSVLPEVTGVPLILRLPGGEAAGTLVEEPVTTLDLLPTLCRLLGWPVPADAPGRPLWPREEARAVGPRDEPFLLENLLYEPQQQGVLAWPWLAVRREGESGTTWFELGGDPSALDALAPPAFGEDVLAAADSLDSGWEATSRELRNSSMATAPLPPELERRLRALGY